MRTCGVLAILISVPGPAQVPLNQLEQRVIAAAKKADVNVLDQQIRRAPFGEWLQKQVGATTHIEWESNDCGEQDGFTKRDDFPLCGEAIVKFPDGGTLGVQVAVGSYRKGVQGTPVLWFLYVQDKRGQIYNSRRLADLPKLLQKLQ